MIKKLLCSGYSEFLQSSIAPLEQEHKLGQPLKGDGVRSLETETLLFPRTGAAASPSVQFSSGCFIYVVGLGFPYQQRSHGCSFEKQMMCGAQCCQLMTLSEISY